MQSSLGLRLAAAFVLLFAHRGAAAAGEAKVKPRGLPRPVAEFRKVVESRDIEAYSRAALALRKWMIENDPHRPIYHFTGPESWINDPNGPIYHKGKYHLFYQFDPIISDGRGGWRRSARCWGHAVSEDLVHWVDWPVALWPDSPHDRGGVYSGNTVVDEQGVPCALYTGNVAGQGETYGMLARSTDGWRTWQKTMVMDNSQRPNAESPVHWDGQVWRDGNRWCQLIGGTTGGSGRQGAVRFGLKLRVPADGGPGVRVWYDPKTDQFGMDGAATRKASARAGIPADGPTSPHATLRVFLDRSILEIYCGGAALTGRTFCDPKALGVDLFADGGPVRLETLDVWQMHSMWEH